MSFSSVFIWLLQLLFEGCLFESYAVKYNTLLLFLLGDVHLIENNSLEKMPLL